MFIAYPTITWSMSHTTCSKHVYPKKKKKKKKECAKRNSALAYPINFREVGVGVGAKTQSEGTKFSFDVVKAMLQI